MRNIKNRRLFTSYVSITVIMSIVLFLFGFFGIFFISSNSIANSFKEDFSVSIFFKENAKKIEIIQLQNELLMSSYIQKLKYISKDDALLIMKEEYGQDFIQELGFNPLVNSIDINLKSEFVEASSLDSISAIISKKKYVDEITYDKNLINSINNNIKRVSLWLMPSIMILSIITFLVIIFQYHWIGFIYMSYFKGGCGICTISPNLLSCITPLGHDTKVWAISGMPVGFNLISIGGFAA